MRDGSEKRKKSHKGITLVELVITVAILGIMGGLMSYNAFVINGYRARKCKNNMATAISELKVKTLSKAEATGKIYMEIYKDGKSYFMKTHAALKGGSDTPEEPIEVGNRVIIKYGSDSSTLTEVGEEGSGLEIIYNRSTGALVKKVSDGVYTTSDIRYIRVSAGDKDYEIELVPETGKVINKS